MTLRELLQQVIVVSTTGEPEGLDVEVRRVHCDSRKVGAGDVFAAIVDVYRDGRQFIETALEAGAVAIVLGETPTEAIITAATAANAPIVVVPHVATALGQMSAALMDHPSGKLELIGITGTNGKTTTAHLLEAILLSAGRSPGLLGTATGARYAGKVIDTGLTTPEAPALQEVLADMVACGVTTAAMEVSSHGIALKRSEGCTFTVGVLTGVGSDHLDFHADHEEYAQTKVNWILGEVQDSKQCRGVVVPADDDYGMEVHREFRKNILTFGFDDDADVYPSALELTPTGSKGRIATPEGTLTFDLKLPGRHNVRNAMAAIGAAQVLGVEPIAIVEGLMRVRGVPGRFEAVPNDKGITVLVDYAHTPDALQAATASLRELTDARLIVVFGCGGDRDKTKRPAMARVVSEGADLMVVTSDNPRSEPPHQIIEEILLGIPVDADPTSILVEPDRAAAIEMAIEAAREGDVVLIAGKGHETGQVIGDEKIDFDDRVVAAEVLGG